MQCVREQWDATQSCKLNAADESIKKNTVIEGSLLRVKYFKCRFCQAVVQKSPEKKVNLDGDTLQVVEKFWCLGDVRYTKGIMHDLVVFKTKTGCNIFKVSGILCGKRPFSRIKDRVLVYKILLRILMC